MTREETITYFKDELQNLKSNYDRHKEDFEVAGLIEKEMSAIEVVIQTLEQDPCDDVISRQAVLDIVDGYSESQGNVEDVTQDIISEIMALPPVAPQPKTEKWIEERTYIECPNCHDIWHYEKNQTERFKRCPTCGGVRIK